MKISEYVVCAGWHVFFLQNDHAWVAFVFVLDPATKYLATAIAIVRGRGPVSIISIPVSYRQIYLVD
jgi:hypothetical protein